MLFVEMLRTENWRSHTTEGHDLELNMQCHVSKLLVDGQVYSTLTGDQETITPLFVITSLFLA